MLFVEPHRRRAYRIVGTVGFGGWAKCGIRFTRCWLAYVACTFQDHPPPPPLMLPVYPPPRGGWGGAQREFATTYNIVTHGIFSRKGEKCKQSRNVSLKYLEEYLIGLTE